MSTTGGALGSTAMSGETPGRTATAGETLGIATSSISGSSPSGPPHPHSTGAIIGGSAAAAVIVVLLAILGATLSLRRRLTQSRRDSTGDLRLLASRSSSQCTFATDIVSPISATNTFPEKAYIRSVTTTSALDATSCMPSLPSPTTHLPAPESQRQSVVQADQRDGSASIPPGLGQRSRAPSIRTTDRPVSFALSLNPPYTWKDWPVETGSGQGGVMRNVTTPDMTDSEARSSVVRYSSLTSGPPSYTSLPSP
ncbi:hypothetical protein GY45DRAFT_650321 [Cubamyces sp. BRFM 1775]|nr:hypothetical protein GY45DRAFT_650321 [Cubamyces sp. BRFM 1775]